MMEAFFADHSWIGSDAKQYSPNVYIVDNRTPFISVQLHYSFRDAISDVRVDMGQPDSVAYLPLPAGARPAAGTDGQLVVVNVDSGEEWGLNGGSVGAGSTWSAGGAYRYSIRNSGVPPEGFSQRGAGIGQLAGIVRACEVERGFIGHAVTLAYDFPCSPETCAKNGWPAFIPPFTKTDGKGYSRYDIPEGARLAIRPEITHQQIVDACSGVIGCIVWATNMQEYGGFIVDKSGHPKTYAEGDATAHWDPKIWSKNMLEDIPPEWYVVIDWNFASTKKVE